VTEPLSPPIDGMTQDRMFVVQQHHARRTHYDFRLEMGGVLRSWAIPRGPSLDPSEKRLAVLVADHSLEYAEFEGVIAEDEYGAGEVIVWDHGTYAVIGNETPEEQFAAGKIMLLLGGQKLHGGFVLLRLEKAVEDHAWLLIKRKDKYARPGAEITEERPRSVLSGKTLADVLPRPPGVAPLPMDDA
jgi:bifunctional non-homologous end joining protein LigD